jgi:hypothetical protein
MAPSKRPAAVASLAGSWWEITYSDATQRDPCAFFFEPNGKFKQRHLGAYWIFNTTARWQAEGRRFQIIVPGDDWRAAGTFANDNLRGTVTANGKKTTFSGRRIDPKTYQFPLRKDEVFVTVQLKCYVFEFPPRPKKFASYLQRGGGQDLKQLDKWSIAGFIFQVVAPKEYRGQYITAHHDGLLASGDPTEIALPGKDYRLRIHKKRIGAKDFRICSIDLYIKRAADKRPLGGL